MELFKIFGTLALKGKDAFFKDTDEATAKGQKLANAIGKGLSTAAKVGAAAVGAAATAVGALTKKSLESYAEYEQLVGGVETLFTQKTYESAEEFANSIKSSTAAIKKFQQESGISVDGIIGPQTMAAIKDRLASINEVTVSGAEIVKNNAANAYKTAGMSANEYMATVTSFSASLLQSLGGDTVAAANIADMAITDMSDNANKMGTDIGAIQNAYQGFAKQNYTMLDNLKLGYGGTKTEMERLLKDAEALTGVKYDINSLSDVYEAIHAIQVEMDISGITAEEAAELVASGAMTEAEAFELLGTTAKEANTTIQGSLFSMKAAWSNLLTGIADDNSDLDKLIGNFTASAATAAGNIAPRITQILNGMSTLVTQMAPILSSAIPVIISDILPGMVSAGAQLIQSLLNGISQNADTVAAGAVTIIMMLANSLITNLPTILSVGIQVIVALINGIAQNLPELVPVAIQAISLFYETILLNVPAMLTAGGNLIIGLVTGLYNELIAEMGSLGTWIDSTIVQPIVNFAPNLLAAGGALASRLWEGFTQLLTTAFPGLSKLFGEATSGTMEEAAANMETWTAEAESAAENAAEAAAEAVKAAPELIPVDIKTPVSTMAEVMAEDTSMQDAGTEAVTTTSTEMQSAVDKAGFDKVGKSAMQKFLDGINSMATAISNAVGSIASGAVQQMQSALDGIQQMADGATPDGSHARGLNYVPFDNYIAELHKGEAVLTAEEATAWRAGKSTAEGAATYTVGMTNTAPDPNVARILDVLEQIATNGLNANVNGRSLYKAVASENRVRSRATNYNGLAMV